MEVCCAAYPPCSRIDAFSRLRSKRGAASFLTLLLRRAGSRSYTAPRHEKYVHAQLTAKRIQSSPAPYTTIRQWKSRAFAGRFSIRFCRAMSSFASGPTKGFPCYRPRASCTLWQPAPWALALGDHEMHALRVGAQRAALVPRPFPATGDTVRITRGPFWGVQGCVEHDGDGLTLVVTIQLIHKSFAVRVQAADLEAGQLAADVSRLSWRKSARELFLYRSKRSALSR